RNVEQPAVLAQIEVLGVRAAREPAEDLPRGDVEHADAVRAAVGRRQFALVDTRRRERRSAERDVDATGVRTGMNAAGPLAEHHRRGHLLRIRIDDGELAGSFVRDVDSVAARLFALGDGRWRAAASCGEQGADY